MGIMKDHRFKSIGFKLGLMFFLFGTVIIASIFGIMLRIVTQMEEALIADRLNADINYIKDLIGDGDWNVRHGAIYLGDTLVGDGTEALANLRPFLYHERKTGTFSYVFIRKDDGNLSYVAGTPARKGYMQGPYLRVAGSTKDSEGRSIVGTYIDKQVSDVLDATGVYSGEANVAGSMIYCRYEVLRNDDDQVVGCIVVGRSIAELQSQVNSVIRTMAINIVLAILFLGFILFLLINRWTSTIGRVVAYLKVIEMGDIPSKPLTSQTEDEMETLVTGINLMVDALREKEMLRLKSETDQLTGLANRFGLNRRFEEFFEDCYHNRRPLTVGILDIDFFKPYNDNYGHQAGDRCIVALADVLKEIEGKERVFCARFGGDEFLLIGNGLDLPDVQRIAQEIRDAVAAQHMPHAHSKVANVVTVSQGYCWGVPLEYRKLNDFIYVADSALYEVKRGTKNGFRIVHLTEGFQPVDTDNAE